MGFLELRRQCGVSHEVRRGAQGASRVAPGREGTRASRRVEERLSRSFSGGGGKPSFPSPSAGDLRELPTYEILSPHSKQTVGSAPALVLLSEVADGVC